MESFLYSFISILITILVTHIYFKKSLKTKKLSCFVKNTMKLLTNIDTDIKKKLIVNYDGKQVDSIYQISFIIGNTGDLPIKDVIEPLTLKITDNNEILDVTIVRIEQQGRQINYKIKKESNEVEFLFPLLNSGDYFEVRLLLKSDIKPENIYDINNFDIGNNYKPFKFIITADDIDAEIKTEDLPYEYYMPSPTFDAIGKGITVIALFLMFIVGFNLVYLLYNIKNIQKDLFLFDFSIFFTSFSFYKLSIIIIWIVVFILLIIFIFMLLDFITPKNNKTKFKVNKYK